MPLCWWAPTFARSSQSWGTVCVRRYWRGAKISFINPLELDLNYRADQLVSTPAGMLSDLAAVAKALGLSGDAVGKAQVEERHKLISEQLKSAGNATVLLGNMAAAHPDYSLIRALASAIAEAADAVVGYLPEAANSVGGYLAAALPDEGSDARSMLENTHKGYLLLGIEPGYDFWNPAQAAAAFDQAEFVLALSAYLSPSLEQAADVILPISGFTETSGTYVNAAGSWQSFTGAVNPPGEARPAWKVLRVLGNLLDVEGFDQVSSEEVLEEIRVSAAERKPDNTLSGTLDEQPRLNGSGLLRIGDVPLYAVDPLVRRAGSLQRTGDAASAAIRLNPAAAAKAGVIDEDQAVIVQDGNRVTLPVEIDTGVPDDCVRVSAGLPGTESLGGQFGEVTLEKA